MQSGRKQQKILTPRQRGNRTTARWLLLCFPIGMIMMWSDNCRWPRVIKSAVSIAILALVLVLVLPQTRAPEQKQGGVRFVSNASAAELMGPTISPDAKVYEAYVPKYIPKSTIVVEPTPSPVPYYVYCNDGGEFYHRKKCQYVKSSTPKATLLQAVSAGYKRCKTCKPPTVKEQYGDSLDW